MAKKAVQKRGRPPGSKNKKSKNIAAGLLKEPAKKRLIAQVAEKEISSVTKLEVPVIMSGGSGLACRESGVAGSKNSKFPAMYSLIPSIGLRRVAETCGEGFIKYGQGNWLNGFKQTGLLDHALAHIQAYISGDESEDHIAHAVWNLLTEMHFVETEKVGSELLDLIKQKGRQLAQP